MSLERPRGIHTKETEPIIEKTYRLESGVTVDLQSKWFEATERGADASTVVFLPGWGMQAHSEPIAQLGRSFAESAKSETLTITTRSQERGQHGASEEPDLLYEEARAIATYIKECGLNDVTIVGHSQGGDKAIDVATILQKDKDLRVRGVILLDAVGLYEQSPLKLAINFALDGVRDMTPDTVKYKTGAEVAKVEAEEAVRSGGAFLARFASEVREMARKNPHTAEITVPIVIISGVNDLISSPSRIAPNESERRVVSDGDTDRDITLRAREEALKQDLFPQSPYVRMLVPERGGSHGLPLHRPADVTAASLYMLERYERNQN